jgi:diguanylate cyclase (GGDEF)-like protein/PAS domain S-box-containing protein
VERNRPLHIGFSYFDVVFVWSLVAHTIHEEAKKLGIKLTIWGSPNLEDQVVALDSLIDQGVDALIVSPVVSDSAAFMPVVAKAQTAGIPIVTLGSEIAAADSLPYIGSDNLGGQALITDYALKYIGGKGKVAYIQGRRELAAHSLRARAFRDVLTCYPDVELVYHGMHDPLLSFEESGRTIAQQLLAHRPDVNLVVTSVDRLAMGVISVLEEEKLIGKITVTGFDGIPHAFQAIRQGTLLGTVCHQGRELAKQTLMLVQRLVNGENVLERIMLPVKMVTRENVIDPALEAFRYLPGMLDHLKEENKVRRQLIGSLRTSEERFRSLVELSSDWYWEQDENFRFASNEGTKSRYLNSLIGKTLWELENTGVTDAQWHAHRTLLDAHLPFHDFEFQYVDDVGSVRYISLSGRPVFDQDGAFKSYRGVGKDITERRRSEERIQYLAYYDGLTLLPNRSLFTQRVDQTLAHARRHDRQFAILFIDLDRFKIVNDALGHDAGDELLQEIAKRLQDCLREDDTVARLGGDEFVVLLEISDEKHAATVARKILSNIAQALPLGDGEHQVTASVGIAIYPHDGVNHQTLMKHADIAMYLAKEQGKNNYQFYSDTSKDRSVQQLTLESNLRRALRRNEFLLHYQPKMDLNTREITGVEALLRWQHPELGLVLPSRFIPLAEETGLIVPMGKWVLRTACAQIMQWQKQGLSGFPVAVNLSPRQFFDKGLVKDVADIIKETGVDPALLEFEITESMVMYKTGKAIALLTKLKSLGIRLAIDDFGTGYSSFALLKRFPIDTIKIDRSFIKDIPRGIQDSALTNAIISMGKALNLKIIAEGVEKKEQMLFLQRNACDEMQGAFFSKPLPGDDIVPLCSQHTVRRIRTKQVRVKKTKTSTNGTRKSSRVSPATR